VTVERSQAVDVLSDMDIMDDSMKADSVTRAELDTDMAESGNDEDLDLDDSELCLCKLPCKIRVMSKSMPVTFSTGFREN
jgi:hypothetical protein